MRSMFTTRFIACTACLAALAGCSTVDNVARIRPGDSEEQVTQAAHRSPSRVWHNEDGTRTLEFSNQPLDGASCYMVTVGANGRVLHSEQVDDHAHMDRVRTGMTTEEVRRLLCEPRSVVNFPLSGEQVWDWNDAEGVSAVMLTRFNVHFKEGRVVRTSSRTIDPTDCGLGC